MPGKKILQNMFGLDWRSLALMRMGLAVVILCDLFVGAGDLRVFYTDDGVLPRAVLIANYNPQLCLHLLSGSIWFEGALFALEAGFALMLLFGYRTRLATVACWYLLLSRQARNPLVLFGSDIVLRVALFWAMFLPLNRRFSVDAAMGRTRAPEGPVYLGMAGFGAIVQFILIYLISGILKSGPTWWVNHTAVYYALAIEMYGRPFGQWLNQFDGVTSALTVFTLYFELIGPWLFILPLRRGYVRLLAFVLFAALQIGFGVCMQMGLFWVIMIVFMLMFLPPEFWTWFAEPVGHWVCARWRRAPLPELVAAEKPPTSAIPRRGIAWPVRLLRDGFLFFMACYVVLLNIDTIPGHAAYMPNGLYWISAAAGLDQRFNMFAPDPQADDGWFILLGRMQDGADVDVFTGAIPANFDKPASVANTYIDQLWGSYLLDILYTANQNEREAFALYLGREWNRTHTGGEHLEALQIVFMHELTTDGYPRPPATQEKLWTETFD